MKTKNSNLKLNKAKKEKNDEFYTLYEDVAKIFNHLNNEIFDKYRIVLPFNDAESNFRVFCKRQKINYEIVYNDYKIHLYKNNDLVISNPPFSNLREIVDYFVSKNIKFILVFPKNALTYKNIFNYWKNGIIRFIYLPINRFLTNKCGVKQVSCFLLTNLNEDECKSIFWYPKKSNCKFDVLLGNSIIINSIGKDFEYWISEYRECFLPITFLLTFYAWNVKYKLELARNIYRPKSNDKKYFQRIRINKN